MPEVGEPAPDFTLYDADRKPRSLSEFKGKKVILAFFPGAFTAVCTKELCTFRDGLGELERLGGQLVAVSVDPPFSQKRFAEENGFTFPLLSDFLREVVSKYGVAANDFAGMKGYVAAKRSVFIIDKDGIIRYKWVSDDPRVEPNYDEIRQELAKLG